MAAAEVELLGEPKRKKRKSSPAFNAVDEKMKALITEKFLVTLPSDFYDFWDFLCDCGNPALVLKPYNLRLGGPFDVLLGKSSTDDMDYLLHHRYFYDSPEFQTVLISSKEDSQYHVGYYRDSPTEDPVFLVSNDAEKGCKLTILADNIFAAVQSHLQDTQFKSSAKDFLSKLEKRMESKGYQAGKRTPKIKEREKKVVSKGFHGAGIVVPVDENGVGWREVPMSIGELKKLFTSICAEDKQSDKSSEELQELITYIQFANDECDYGEGLELGNDLFCFGDESLDNYIKALLPMAYSLLGYSAFEKIILAHLSRRTRGSNTYLL